MNFDRTVTWGNVLQIVILVMALVASHVRLSAQIENLSVKVETLWTVFLKSVQ